MKRRREKKKVNYFKIISIILILVFLGITPVLIKKLIIIKNVECSSQYGACPPEIYKSTNLQISNLNDAKKEIEKQLQDSYLIDSFLIQYKIPSTLKVEILIKKPKYALNIKDENKYFLLDKNGLILEQNTQTNLPYVVIDSFNNEVGRVVSDELYFASKLLFSLNWQYQVGLGEIRNESLYVKLPNGLLVILPTTGDDMALIGALRLIYSRLNESDKGIRIENVREIDLRYKNPVIR